MFSPPVGVRADGKAALAITNNQQSASQIKFQLQATHMLLVLPNHKTKLTTLNNGNQWPPTGTDTLTQSHALYLLLQQEKMNK